MDFLKLLGIAGGGVGVFASFVLLFFIPDICPSESSPEILLGFNCFGLGVHSQVEWALVLGAACGGLTALAIAARGRKGPG